MNEVSEETYELSMIVKVLIGYEMHVKLRQDDETLAMSLNESNCLQYIGQVDNDNTSYAKVLVCNGKEAKGIIYTKMEILDIEPLPDNGQSLFDSYTVHTLMIANSSISNLHRSDYIWSPMAYTAKRQRRRAGSATASNGLTLETLVVVDYFLYAKLKDVVPDIEQFVMTLMKIANDLYHHKSLGNKINIVVTKIVIMNQNDQRSLGQNILAQLQLYYFSQWQYQHYPDCDHAVLLTGLSLKGNSYEPIVGSAWSGTMCERMFSNSIVEVNSLLSGITVAHEIGHSFDLRHDQDYGTACSDRSYVMSKQFTMDGELAWSRCSMSKLKEFLNSAYRSRCLHSKQSRVSRTPSSLAKPGELFDTETQCKIRHGSKATMCPGVKIDTICSQLWCRVDGQCTTDHFPAADGTACDSDKWCQSGKCVSSIKSVSTALLGKWSAYSNFGKCSRSCGGGIQFRQRSCISSSGKGVCIGKSKDYRICNLQLCPSNALSYRDRYCQMLGFRKAYVNYYNGKHVESTCDLFCLYQLGRLTVVKNVSKVADGIRCGSASVCFKGVCSPLGCDGIVNSPAKLDRCGICDGENKSCKVIQQELVTYDYEQVQFPQGARNIRVVERFKNGRKEFRLKNRNGQVVVINSPNQNNSYHFGGTEFFSMLLNGVASIEANGPIKEDVFLQSPNHLQLKLEYKISRKEFASINSYGWIAFETKCSASCGKGSKVRYTKCGSVSTNSSVILVPEYICASLTQPKNVTLSCNNQPCPTKPQFTYKWHSVTYPCSKSCGSGVQSIIYKCYKVESDQLVTDEYCGSVVKPFSYIRRCNTKPCESDVKWITSKWSSCSKSCGGGIKFRSVACSDSRSGRIIQGECPAYDVPTSSSSCNNHKCIVGKWKVHAWTKCERTNNGCTQTRQLDCYNPQNDQILQYTECDNSARPERIRSCQAMACG